MSTSTGSRLPRRRAVGWPMTVTWGLCMALMIRFVIVSTGWPMAEWMEATLDYVGKNPEIQLVVRVHPNAGSRNSLGVNSEDIQYYSALAERAPPNVRVVQPRDPVSSYSLMMLGDLGLVWHSTAGVEMATLGKRVIKVGSGFLRSADFLVEVPSADAFEGILDDCRRPLNQRDALGIAVRARRWAYILYFRQSWRLSLVTQPSWNKARVTYKTMAELGARRHADLDRIIDIFQMNKPVYPQPEEVPATRSSETETQMTSRILGIAR